MNAHVRPYFRRRKSRLQKSARTALVIALLYAIVFSQLDWMIPRSRSHPWLEPMLPWSAVVGDMSTILILNSLTVYVLAVLILGVIPEMIGHEKQRVGPPAHSRIPLPPEPPPKTDLNPVGSLPNTGQNPAEGSSTENHKARAAKSG